MHRKVLLSGSLLFINGLNFQKKVSFSGRRNFSFDISPFSEALISMHQASGLPWWSFVPLATITFRSVFTLPIAILQRKRLQRQHQLRPLIDSMYPILKFNLMHNTRSSSSSAPLTYEQVTLLLAKEKRKRQTQLFKQHKCETWKSFLLPMVQVPLWVLLSLTMRNISGWADDTAILDPTLSTQGISWLSDLAAADPNGVLPVVLGAVSLANLEFVLKFNSASVSMVQGSQNQQSSRRVSMFNAITSVSRMSVVFFMGIASQAPAVLGLYWVSSNMFSLLQNLAFQYTWPLRKSIKLQVPEEITKKLGQENTTIPYIDVINTTEYKEGKLSEKKLDKLLV